MRLTRILLLPLLLLAASCAKDAPEPDSPGVPPTPEVRAVEGAFSVSATRQVRFAAGNVVCSSWGRWGTAKHQYDLIGKPNARSSTSPSHWVDLFGWGTGDRPLLRTIDTCDYATFVDWGIHFGHGWRTLGEEEWDYLLYYRPNALQLTTTAVVCKTKGVLLLPDQWECPGGITLACGNFDFANTLNERQFERLEEAGAVFLPSAGFRQGATYNEGALCYWTSTSVGVAGFEGMRVFLDLTPEDSFVGLKGMSAYCGLAVRLAQDITPKNTTR